MVKNNNNPRDFGLFIDKQRKIYKSIVSVDCPILANNVIFDSDGFNHLIYESNRKPRKLNEQYLKLINLKYVPEILKTSKHIAEVRVIQRKIKKVFKKAICYEVVGMCDGKKLGIIVERIGTGKFKFKSIMTYYKRRKTKKLP